MSDCEEGRKSDSLSKNRGTSNKKGHKPYLNEVHEGHLSMKKNLSNK